MKILILFLSPIILFAHALSVNAFYESGELYIESMFGNGKACKGCGFVVKNKDIEVLKGDLDENGLFEREIALKAPITINIDGGMGHQAEMTIEASDIEQEVEEKSVATTPTVSKESLSNIDEETLRKIIKSELNKQNAKIETLIEKNKSTTEQMLMGLGYILGIFGLWQLFARKKES